MTCFDTPAFDTPAKRTVRAVAAPSRRVPAVRWPVRAALLALALPVLAGGCISRDPNRSGLFEPYRFDLPQGNYVTREMLDQIKAGMNREQVRFALGSPLLQNTFRTDRWDYVFRYQHANGQADLRRVTIRFKDEQVAAIEADELPQRDDASDPALPGSRRNPAPKPVAPVVPSGKADEKS